MNTLDLSQIVETPTHSTSSGQETKIDLCFLSQPESLLSCCTAPPLGSSDHKSLLVFLKCAYSRQKMLKTSKTLWNFKKTDKKMLSNIIHKTNWDDLITGDIEQSWQNWKYSFIWL